jgi:hypothetical protein
MSWPFHEDTYLPIDIWKDPWISATQISTFELCNRKWAWRWLEHIKAPPNKFAQLGIDTHGELENWLKWGRVPIGTSKQALLAQAMIPYLPPPQAVGYDPLTAKNVERDELIVVQDVLFNIKVDLFMPQQLSWDGVLRPRTYDHKTSKDPDKWAPKPEHIHCDPQAALYAAWTIIVTKETTIDLQWNYVKTQGATKVLPVCATVTDEMIAPRMLANIETGRAIKHHIQNTKRALDVVFDASACNEYGGCPYQDRCNLTARERIVAVMNDFKHQPATSQFLAGLPGQNGAAVNPPQFQPPQQQPLGFQPPPVPGGQFAAPPQQQFAAPPAAPQFQPPPGPSGQFASSVTPQQFTPPQPPPQQQFQPPQQQFQPPPQQQFQPPPQQQFQPPPQQQFQPPQQAPQPPPAQQFVPPQQVAAPVAEKAPGRPKQSKEHDMTGAWAILAAGAVQLTGGNVPAAAQIADQLVAELKARQ